MNQEKVPVWVTWILRDYGHFSITEDLKVEFWVKKDRLTEKYCPVIFEEAKKDIPNIDYLVICDDHIAVFDFPGGYLESYEFKYNNDRIEIKHFI